MNTYTTIAGDLLASSMKFGIVVSRFNSLVTDRLLSGAVDCLSRHGVPDGNVTVVVVPGAVEIPLAAQSLAALPAIDAVICLGAVIRGETSHYDYVCSMASSGLMTVSLESKKPISMGILTTHTTEQALDRAGGKSGNKGWDAAMTAIEMVSVQSKLQAKQS